MYLVHTGMRRGEILRLPWDRVDLKSGFTRLKEGDRKTGEPRIILIGRELRGVLRNLSPALDPQDNRVLPVFTRHGPRISRLGKCLRECVGRPRLAILSFMTCATQPLQSYDGPVWIP
jgi:integrase